MRLRVLGIIVALLLGGGQSLAEPPPTTANAGREVEQRSFPLLSPRVQTCTITGSIKAEAEIPLSEMVIYLESTDPSYKIAAPPKPIAVSQKGAKFSPALLIVCIGQTVEFLNDEDRPIEHNVFSNAPAKRFDLGLYRPGENRTVTFDKPGAVFCFCSIHRYMDGVVYVTPTPWSSRVDASGKFQITGIPLGAWKLQTWQRRRRFAEQTIPVNLEPSKPVNLDLELHRK